MLKENTKDMVSCLDFGFLSNASYECEAYIGDSTKSLEFRIEKASIIFASDFFLVSAEGGGMLHQIV